MDANSGYPRRYTRWTKIDSHTLTADLLGTRWPIEADTATGHVSFGMNSELMTPDEARMVGVRLIEAATLADGARAIREVGT